MFNKAFFVSLVLFALSFSVCFAQTFEQQKALIYSHIDARQWSEADAAVDKLRADFPAEPNLPESLYLIATRFSTHEQYGRAESIHRGVLSDYPGSYFAGTSQYRLTRLAILTKTEPQAQAEFNKLVTDFSSHQRLPAMLYVIAETYERCDKSSEATTIYERIVSNHPNSLHGELVSLKFAKGNDSEVQTALNRLVTDFANDANVPNPLWHVADDFQRSGFYGQAKDIYQEIVSHYPNSFHAGISQNRIVAINLKTGNDTEVQQAFDTMVTQFSTHPHFPAMLYETACSYVKYRRDYDKAGQLYQLIVSNHPNSLHGELVSLKFAKGNDSEVQTALNRLVTDFASDTSVPQALWYVADEFQRSGFYGQAKDIYQAIVSHYPNSFHAGISQNRVVAINLKTGNDTEVQQAFDTMVAQFSTHRRFAAMLYLTAHSYIKCRQDYDKAEQLYQLIISDYPTSEYAVFAQKQLVNLASTRGDFGAADSGMNTLTTNYSSDSRLAEMLYDIAKRSEDTGRYEKAKDIYNQIVQQHPESSVAGRAEIGVRRVDIMPFVDSGDNAAADAAIDQLIVDFNNHPDLAYVISRGIAERHLSKAIQLKNDGLADQAKGQFQRAITLWERIVDELPNSDEAPRACSCAGGCYHRLNEYQKSIECFQKVIDDYPQYRFAWNALRMVGQNYERLKDLSAVSESEADPKIKAAYQQILEQYPYCPEAEYAQRWIDRYNSE